MVVGHRGNQISCRGREMFVGSNLVLQWVPESGKVVQGDTKMSPGVLHWGVLICLCSFAVCAYNSSTSVWGKLKLVNEIFSSVGNAAAVPVKMSIVYHLLKLNKIKKN